ncbi:hypothetical protein KIW84_022327 [Lathyrus oleraceus]|uniref:Uncharacterized protein n=1 Tax=Pisum sativum TaxID=3888 RepID=A0A9D4YBE5_PEA|nr:hypothetical protein KIW84_022327 [Pisum sativum]
MHIDFAIPIDGSLMAGFKAYEKKAKKSCMDYGFHMAITKWDETVAREMELMVAAGSLTRKSRRASPGGRNTHIRKARSAQTSLKVELDEVNSGAALSRASSLGLSFSFTGFSVPLDEISSSKPFSDDEDIHPVISDALGGILVGLVTSHDGGVENGEPAVEVTNEGVDAAGHTIGTTLEVISNLGRYYTFGVSCYAHEYDETERKCNILKAW